MAKVVKKFIDRKTEIIKAAHHLFQTQEYDKTTIQDIMNALGIAKGTIYHYFVSKEDLLEAVIQDIVEKMIEQMQVAIKKSKGSALQKIQLLVKKGSVAAENANIVNQLHKRGNDAMHSRILAAILIKQAPLYAELIEQGKNEGIFKTETPLECAEFILSGMSFLTDLGIYPWTQKDLTRRIKAFPKIIEQQLQAPPGSFRFLVKQMSNG